MKLQPMIRQIIEDWQYFAYNCLKLSFEIANWDLHCPKWNSTRSFEGFILIYIPLKHHQWASRPTYRLATPLKCRHMWHTTIHTHNITFGIAEINPHINYMGPNIYCQSKSRFSLKTYSSNRQKSTIRCE